MLLTLLLSALSLWLHGGGKDEVLDFLLTPVAMMAEVWSSASRRWQMRSWRRASPSSSSCGRAPLLPCAGPSALGEHVTDSLELLVMGSVVGWCFRPLQDLRALRGLCAGLCVGDAACCGGCANFWSRPWRSSLWPLWVCP